MSSAERNIAFEHGAATPAASLRALAPVRPLYMLPRDPFPEQILIPAFAVAQRVDCMVGFFSSAILATLAPGLAMSIGVEL